MMIIIFFILLVTLQLINFFFIKKKILIDRSINLQDSHKKFVTIKKKNIPLSGGVFFLISLSFLIYFIDPVLIFLFFLVFFVGLLSDIHFIDSAKTRIVLQIFIILALVLYTGIKVDDIRIPSFNYFLNYNFISITFTIFCILILINGSNFIDGVNTLLGGYVILVLLTVIYISYKNSLIIDLIFFQYFLIISLVFFIINFLNKCFLGDSGAYLISSFLGFSLLIFFLQNKEISPYFIVVLLWYPAFENLFSVLKRFFFNRKSYLPDNTHLHHKIFAFFSKKNNFKKNQLSTITGLVINSYNFFIFLVASQNIYSTKFQVNVILFNIIFYLIIYYSLCKVLKNKQL